MLAEANLHLIYVRQPPSRRYTSQRIDWIQDALAFTTDDFLDNVRNDFPAAANTTQLFGDPKVHQGFYDQFNSLAVSGIGHNNLTQALYSLSNGQEPLYVTISGFSLGGALAELSAIWSAYKWPQAHVFVASQGAPKVGNADYVTMYRSVVGMAWRFVFDLDQVPSLPPLPGYETTRNPIWIASEGGGPFNVLLQARPNAGLGVTTW